MSKLMSSSQTQLHEFIDQALEERYLTEDDVILCGVLMGAIHALHFAFERSVPCRGVIASNGYWTPFTGVKSVPKNILMIGGKADTVIPFWLQEAFFSHLKDAVAPRAKAVFVDAEGHDGFVLGSQQEKAIKQQLQALYY